VSWISSWLNFFWKRFKIILKERKKMKSIHRCGKSIHDIFTSKASFWLDKNDDLLNDRPEIVSLYRQQEKRKACKICDSLLPKEHYFINHGTGFFMCTVCGHLNGEFEDGLEFTKAVYESGVYYSKSQYIIDPVEYKKRVDASFVPQARFIMDSFQLANIDSSAFRFLDIGAGNGHMTYALHNMGVDVMGIELNEAQVSAANEMIGKDLLKAVSAEDVTKTIKTTERQVLLFVNVLEHITNLNEVFESIKENKNIKYICFSVPYMSFTCIFESIFTDVFPRILGGGGGHTHLFTQDSIEWIFKKYMFKRVATWTFGLDIMDLFRSVIVRLKKNGAHEDLINKVLKISLENADAMQQVIDNSGFASDALIVAEV
jgi:tRNA G46 methylase TrmB